MVNSELKRTKATRELNPLSKSQGSEDTSWLYETDGGRAYGKGKGKGTKTVKSRAKELYKAPVPKELQSGRRRTYGNELAPDFQALAQTERELDLDKVGVATLDKLPDKFPRIPFYDSWVETQSRPHQHQLESITLSIQEKVKNDPKRYLQGVFTLDSDPEW